MFQYGIEEKYAKNYKQYLNFKIDEKCCYYEPLPYIDVNLYQYSTAINYLSNKYDQIQLYKKMMIKAKELNGKKLIESQDNITDDIIVQYVKNRPNTFMFVFWTPSHDIIYDVINYMQQLGSVSAFKKLNIDKKIVKNIMCEIYMNDILKKNNAHKRLELLENLISYKQINDNNTIHGIVFENVNNLSYDDIKNQLTDYTFNSIKNKNPKINIEKQDVLYMTKYFYETIELSQIFFNKETILFLSQRKIENWLDEDFLPTYLRLNSIKKWQITNLSTIDAHEFFLYDDSTIATLGIRKTSNINGMILNNNNYDIIKHDLFDENTKIPFMDVEISNTNLWHDKQNYMDKIHLYFKKNLLQYNRFYYWNGIKIFNLENLIEFKLNRFNLSDYIDLKAMNEIHNFENIIVYDDKTIKSEKKEEIDILLKRYLKYDRMRIKINYK